MNIELVLLYKAGYNPDDNGLDDQNVQDEVSWLLKFL